MTEDSVVIINGARTPVGVLLGALTAIPAPELTATAIAAALERSGVQASDIDEVFMDCVLPAAMPRPARGNRCRNSRVCGCSHRQQGLWQRYAGGNIEMV